MGTARHPLLEEKSIFRSCIVLKYRQKIRYFCRVFYINAKSYFPFFENVTVKKHSILYEINSLKQSCTHTGLKKVHHRRLWILVSYESKSSAHIQSEVHWGPWMDYLLCNFNALPPALKFSKFQSCVTNWRRVWNRKTAVHLLKRSWFLSMVPYDSMICLVGNEGRAWFHLH